MNKEFEVHRLSEERFAVNERIAQHFDELLEHLIAILPPGREFSIVRTKLEEACFFAKKANANASPA